MMLPFFGTQVTVRQCDLVLNERVLGWLLGAGGFDAQPCGYESLGTHEVATLYQRLVGLSIKFALLKGLPVTSLSFRSLLLCCQN
jgi:hypothetical protein